MFIAACDARDRRPDQGQQSTTQLKEASQPKVLASCTGANSEVCQIESDILELTNRLRSQNGLAPLLLDPTMSRVARSWSNSQIRIGRISHDGFPHERLSAYQMMTRGRSRKSPRIISENVARHTFMNGGQEHHIGSVFVDSWINSPGHLKNMRGPGTRIGIGVVRWGNTWVGTQIFHSF